MKDRETGRQGDKETSDAVLPSPCLPVSLSPCLPFRRGAIVLCGGRSTRMGRDKASLSYGPSEMLIQRVVRLIAEVVPLQQIVCVGAVGQALPALPAQVRIISDDVPHSGPLAGLARGLAQISDDVETVFVTGCDAPLLQPAFIQRMFDLLGNHTIAAPHDGRHWHPLAAVYRPSALPLVESLLATGERSLIGLLDAGEARRVSLNELCDVDPELHSLAACNTPAEYEAALRVLTLQRV